MVLKKFASGSLNVYSDNNFLTSSSNQNENNGSVSIPCESCGAIDHDDSSSPLCIIYKPLDSNKSSKKCGETNHVKSDFFLCRYNKVKFVNLA
jgi:hypothetical protein